MNTQETPNNNSTDDQDLLDKTYNPAIIEQNWYQFWETHGYFEPTGDTDDTYSIVIPPPNVTGSLHMGHAFQYTIMDILIRYHRMCGKKTLWQMGTDAAGIATQMVVERQLNQQNIKRSDLTREEFVAKVWEWKKVSGNRIKEQIKRLGASVDWSTERFTMDAGMTQAVNKAFVTLYDQGLIYKGERLVNWDPILHTALSDLEVENVERQGYLWYIKYPIKNSDQFITIATTRPETLLGDTAVAVNPQDPRYKNLIGAEIALPLTDRVIPIIADETIELEFGTGAVKITPAHDFNDFETGKRHNLPMINILTVDAKLNHNAPTKYQGLPREQARKQVLADLTELGLLEKTVDHTNKLPVGDRSGAVVEPYLVPQWYVKIAPLAEQAKTALNNKTINFVPENYINMYNSWMNELQDWCISRQLWWGNRIPAWYDDAKNVYVAETIEQARAKYNLAESIKLEQETDTLDTWFAASIWPAASLGWPQDPQKYNSYYPTNVLVTGFDIIFFWVARMIMMGMHFNTEIPFKNVYFTGLIRDSQGQKMSKSKGNIIDPLDLIDGISLDDLVAKRTSNMMQPKIAEQIKKQTLKEYPEGIVAFGSDALRFTLCALASHTRNINFDLKRVEGYRNFCNKLWNATRFVLMNTENKAIALQHNKQLDISQFNLIDQWIISLLQETTQAANNHINNYRFDLLAQSLYEFIWNEYCDWYLELSKANLNSPEVAEADKANTRFVLLYVIENILKLLHPIIPFITEEIWQKVTAVLNINTKSIMVSTYPQYHEQLFVSGALTQIDLIKNIIVTIRNIRGEMNVSPAKAIAVCYIKNCTLKESEFILDNLTYFKLLAKVENIEIITQDTKFELPPCATGIASNLEILIPLAGLIDVDAERARLARETSKLHAELEKITIKLSNASFVSRAPAQVVAQEQTRQEEIKSALSKLEQQEKNLATLDKSI